MKRVLLLLTLLLAAAACRDSQPNAPSTSSGPYSQVDLVVGTGTMAVNGSRVTVTYGGWFYDTSRPDGKGQQFDGNSTGFPFTVGAGQVIRGWDQGVPGMRIGGQRRLIIPPELAYGNTGYLSIPPNATLVFDIGLLTVQ